MNWGLQEKQYQIIKKLLIEPLISHGAKLYVFGSRARGTQHPFSDIDILYIETSENSISASLISQIKENLEDSQLTIKVDLVKYEDLAKSYLPNIDKEKVQIFF